MWRRWSWRWWVFQLAFVVVVIGGIGFVVSLTTGADATGWFIVFMAGVILSAVLNPVGWRRSKNGPPGQS